MMFSWRYNNSKTLCDPQTQTVGEYLFLCEVNSIKIEKHAGCLSKKVQKYTYLKLYKTHFSLNVYNCSIQCMVMFFQNEYSCMVHLQLFYVIFRQADENIVYSYQEVPFLQDSTLQDDSKCFEKYFRKELHLCIGVYPNLLSTLYLRLILIFLTFFVSCFSFLKSTCQKRNPALYNCLISFMIYFKRSSVSYWTFRE